MSCTCPEISNLCNDVETITFSEVLEKRLSIYHNNIVNSENWIDENIKEEEVIPEVYSLIANHKNQC